MSTLRELAAESIGRITRRGLEPQIAQIDEALAVGEKVVAVAPGHEGGSGVVVVLTDRRLLASRGAPFAKPALQALALDQVVAVSAAADGATWSLSAEHGGGPTVVGGMFDRDAQRFAALLSA